MTWVSGRQKRQYYFLRKQWFFLQTFNTFSCSATADTYLIVHLLLHTFILVTTAGSVLQYMLLLVAGSCRITPSRGRGRCFGIFSPKDDDRSSFFSVLGFPLSNRSIFVFPCGPEPMWQLHRGICEARQLQDGITGELWGRHHWVPLAGMW